LGVQRITLILICVLAAGCATVPQQQAPESTATPAYTEAAASALAFDPPIAGGAVLPELARGPRAPSAFFGYTESTVELYTSATDDLRSNQFGDVYTQEAFSVKSGIRYR